MQGQHVHRMLVWDQHLGVREMAGVEHAAQHRSEVKAKTLAISGGLTFIETRGKIFDRQGHEGSLIKGDFTHA